jgi:hypothetical protein
MEEEAACMRLVKTFLIVYKVINRVFLRGEYRLLSLKAKE